MEKIFLQHLPIMFLHSAQTGKGSTSSSKFKIVFVTLKTIFSLFKGHACGETLQRYLTQQYPVCIEILRSVILNPKRICIRTFLNKILLVFLVLYQLYKNSSSELKLPQLINQHSCSEQGIAFSTVDSKPAKPSSLQHAALLSSKGS